MQAREFTGDLEAFEALDAVVLGVSPDSTAKHGRFRAKHDLTVTLLSDADTEMMKSYGAFGSKLTFGVKALGVKRSTVLIDPKGNIAHHWPSVRAKGHAAEVRAVLEELRGA